ncbi:MAG: 3'(2'),5'-bisphosphate nucleotidase CysQ [PS1 clade bacterium]|uniref:3'(2'),5'-bisphosphate nucleotidase CysQ n=1 Tax=PS1 clade bacterium TaxID=2175152 RepID=A0A937HK97_9PROT|nr:3'(2'),5'-bisphosphate nucleotidase CysQ [PS1 clade bacterium]
MHAMCQMALDAGAVIMTHYKNGVAEEKKADKSPVTQADRDAEILLEKALGELVPHVQVIGEEAHEAAAPTSLDDVFFLLDPLDGTRDFVARKDNFTVNIGLVSNRYPIAGVIYAPVHEKLYFSGTQCAYRLTIAPDGALDISKAEPLMTQKADPQGLRVIASRSHRGEKTDQMIASLNVKNTIAAASSYKFCLLAEGTADFYPRYGRTMEWDTAAGQAILEAAGGIVTTEDGERFSYGKLERGLDNPSFIAAAADNWQDALK